MSQEGIFFEGEVVTIEPCHDKKLHQNCLAEPFTA